MKTAILLIVVAGIILFLVLAVPETKDVVVENRRNIALVCSTIFFTSGLIIGEITQKLKK